MEVTQEDRRGSFYEQCVCMCVGAGGWGRDVLEQWSPTFSAPGTSFMEDKFSMGWGWGFVWDDSSTLHFLCPLVLT